MAQQARLVPSLQVATREGIWLPEAGQAQELSCIGRGEACQGVGYCTTAQALADYAAIIQSLQRETSERAAVVAFGGSYGGMLSGWMRTSLVVLSTCVW